MIVCKCNAIPNRDIRAAVDWMRAADTQTIITPGKVCRALNKRPDRGGCLPLRVADRTGCDNLEAPMQLHGVSRATTQKSAIEGRRTGHQYVAKTLFGEPMKDAEGHIDFPETQLHPYETLGVAGFGQVNADSADNAK